MFHFSTTTHYSNKRIITFVTELLFAMRCTGVPNKVTSEAEAAGVEVLMLSWEAFPSLVL